jgi:hypothetical protein
LIHLLSSGDDWRSLYVNDASSGVLTGDDDTDGDDDDEDSCSDGDDDSDFDDDDDDDANLLDVDDDGLQIVRKFDSAADDATVSNAAKMRRQTKKKKRSKKRTQRDADADAEKMNVLLPRGDSTSTEGRRPRDAVARLLDSLNTAGAFCCFLLALQRFIF